MHQVITKLGTKWFDLLAVRNESPYGSSKYNRAEAKMEKIENEASILVFGDTNHTMAECINGKEDER